jgi:hypothetical protein
MVFGSYRHRWKPLDLSLSCVCVCSNIVVMVVHCFSSRLYDPISRGSAHEVSPPSQHELLGRLYIRFNRYIRNLAHGGSSTSPVIAPIRLLERPEALNHIPIRDFNPLECRLSSSLILFYSCLT